MILDRKPVICDTPLEVTCSQLHAVFNNFALIEIAKQLKPVVADNEKEVEKLKKTLSLMSSRSLDENDEEDMENNAHMMVRRFEVPLKMDKHTLKKKN